jgi:predicted Zn-dependent protease
VTSDPPNSPDGVRDLVAGAARALPADDPHAHVFFELRADVRTTLTSAGFRESVESRSRGAAIAGRRSVHLTEPEFMDPGGFGARAPSQARELLGQAAEEWVPLQEESVIAAGNAAAAGRRHPYWSAKVVSFHQEVWVGSRGRDVIRDIRHGRRLEIRVRIGHERAPFAIEELVVDAKHQFEASEAFVRAFERAEARLSHGPPPKPGETIAVLAPGVAGVVAHELIGHSLEGDVVSRGLSWIRADDFPAAARPVTVIDDPRRARGAWTIDDEGVAAGETCLLDRGRPVGVLLDRSSASALGKISTGHGRRSSYLDAVLPRMGCTFIEPGGDDPEDVLRETRAGVYIRRLTAGHTDPLSGWASFLVTDADRIVDGRLAEPLDVFVLELDGRESWRSIDRVGHDLVFDRCVGSCMRDGQPLAVSVGAPTIRIGVARVHS